MRMIAAFTVAVLVLCTSKEVLGKTLEEYREEWQKINDRAGEGLGDSIAHARTISALNRQTAALRALARDDDDDAGYTYF